MADERDDEVDAGAEVRICGACGHAEEEHRTITDEPERGRPTVCLTCGDRHPFTALVELADR